MTTKPTREEIGAYIVHVGSAFGFQANHGVGVEPIPVVVKVHHWLKTLSDNPPIVTAPGCLACDLAGVATSGPKLRHSEGCKA